MYRTACGSGHAGRDQPKPSRKPGASRINNSYTSGTPRERASDRDQKFYKGLDPGKEKSRITRGESEKMIEKPEVPQSILNTQLHVRSIDLHVPDNTEEHHTDAYECTKDTDDEGKAKSPELVIRRGQEFKMTITFNREYNIKKNDIKLLFNIGDDYKPNKGMNVTFTVNETGDTPYKAKRSWGATVVDQKECSLTLAVFVPATVPIGEWEFGVKTIVDVENGKDLIWQYNHTSNFVNIIFNPWCKEDVVYMEDKEWLDEAVLNDAGCIYNGSFRKVGARPWYYGQFEQGILECALHLVRKAYGYQACPMMGNPVSVSRAMSAIVNAPDDGGVLTGNWSNDYSGGRKPTSWNGSVKILQQYMATRQAVRYGQCWVFSGITTTVCRALGIPTRSVTNFASAHNTDNDRLSIDVITVKDKDGDEMIIKNDSIWNFHVWNEVWMRRSELNTDTKNYDGWQVIDATPQEYSDGIYCCGPAPVSALKEGQLDVGSDSKFVYAEVNADKVWFEQKSNGTMVEKKRRRDVVGKFISTHKPTGKPYSGSTIGSFLSFFGVDNLERLDLTECYKYKEGSKEEKHVNRLAEKKFRQMCGHESDEECEREAEDPVEIDIAEMDDVDVGKGFDFKVKVKNNGKEKRTMNLVLTVLYKTYCDTVTGTAALKKFHNIALGPGDSEMFEIGVDEHRANQRPQDGFNFDIQACAKFEENSCVISEDMDFRLRRPDLVVKGPKTCKAGERLNVVVSLKNPLLVPLTKCELSFEGGFRCVGSTRNIMMIRNNIPPGMHWEETLSLVPLDHPKNKKARDLSIGFDARELSEVNGQYTVLID